MTLTVSAFVLLAAAISWVATYYLMPLMGSPASGMMGVASIVSSLSPASVGLFESVWVVGMVAMMFPAMIPMVVFYNKVVAKVESKPSVARLVGTPFFLFGYLAAYAGLGLLAYFGVFFALGLGSSLSTIWSLAPLGPTLVLVIAGVYQLSPLKSRCLTYCTSPANFFALRSQEGLLGSIRMGFSHGEFCVGCCWAYMLVMLVVAVMSLPFMAFLAALIALEKVTVRGANWFTKVIAVGFILLGVTSYFVSGLVVSL